MLKMGLCLQLYNQKVVCFGVLCVILQQISLMQRDLQIIWTLKTNDHG